MHYHIPVLPQEVMAGLNLVKGGRYLDCTVGGGGHSALILTHPETTLTAIDRDREAIQVARIHLQDYTDRVKFWQGNFRDFVPQELFHGIVADLGVSSAQLDIADRGFSFRQEAPLDMRMDQSQTLTAGDIVNYYDEANLADILYTLGEERFSRRIAKGIVQSRPIGSTTELAGIITRSVPAVYRHHRIHCATRSFQALRLAVNQELESLQTWLNLVPQWLVPGGRLVVISFHSLEDRIVKTAFKQDDRLITMTKKPIVPTVVETKSNPRSRSAKLRIAQKVEQKIG